MPPPRTRPQHVRFRGDLCAALPKVACNSTDRTFLTTQKRWNCNDTISRHKRLTGKFHATLLGNHDDVPYKIRPRPGQVVSAPVKGQCTRSERVQCLRIGCTTPSVTSSHADLPERTSTYPTGLAGPGGAVQSAGWTPGRQGLTGLRDNEPSGRLATLARHKARARCARRGRGQSRSRAQPTPAS